MPNNENEEEEIVVVGKKTPKPTPEPRLMVTFGDGGFFNNPIADLFRSLFNAETDFYVDRAFSDSQRQIIKKILADISNHPSFSAAFDALRKKGAVVNIHRRLALSISAKIRGVLLVFEMTVLLARDRLLTSMSE